MQVTGNKSLVNNSLSIRISAGGFSFIITEPNGKVIGTDDYVVREGETLITSLGGVLAHRAQMNPEYERVNVLVDEPSTRVPLDEFHSDEAQAIYRLAFGMQCMGAYRVMYDVMPELEAVDIYRVDVQLCALLGKFYPDAKWRSYCGHMLLRAYDYDRQHRSEQGRLFVAFGGQEMNIYSFQDGRLVFANGFKAHSVPNQMYFILAVWKQLALNQLQDECVLLAGGSSELQTELRKYIKNVVCE